MILISVDLMDGKVVRLLRGNPKNARIYSDDPISVADQWINMGFGLHIVDLDAALDRGNNQKIIEKLLRLNGFKEVSGGIRNADRARQILSMGADRIVIGTMAFTDRQSLLSLKGLPVAVSIDVTNGKVSIYGWQRIMTINFLQAIRELERDGFDKFEITFIDMDGTRLGLNTKLAELIPFNMRKNIIISGGIRLDDVEAVNDMGFAGCIVGSDAYEKIYNKNS
ncbi:MAG: HisA/HisF-related TIM barrel protein [Nitrososphaeria archaeon]